MIEWIEYLARLSVSTIVVSTLIFTVVRALSSQAPGRLGRFVSDLMDALIYAGILVYLVIRPFVAQPFYIPSESMVPTLLVKDFVMVGKFNYRMNEPERGDVVVFRAPDHALHPGQVPGKTDFIKRLVGLPGDVIEIKSGEGVYLNGKLVEEPYLNSPPNYNMKIRDGLVYEYDAVGNVWKGGEGMKHEPVLDEEEANRAMSEPSQPIPSGKYLMLGDNRPASSDGHEWGLLDEWRVVGKALFKFWPPGRIGKVN